MHASGIPRRISAAIASGSSDMIRASSHLRSHCGRATPTPTIAITSATPHASPIAGSARSSKTRRSTARGISSAPTLVLVDASLRV